MGLDVSSKIIVGYRKEDAFRRREVISIIKKFNEDTGEAYHSQKKEYVDEILIGVETEICMPQWIAFDEFKMSGLGILFHTPDYESDEGILIGIALSGETDMRDHSYVGVVLLHEIMQATEKLTGIFGREPQIFNQLRLSY